MSKTLSLIAAGAALAALPALAHAAGHPDFTGAWMISALGLPICLVMSPVIGGLLLVVSLALANANVVRSASWRRQYELSIHRLLRTKRSKLAG